MAGGEKSNRIQIGGTLVLRSGLYSLSWAKPPPLSYRSAPYESYGTSLVVEGFRKKKMDPGRVGGFAGHLFGSLEGEQSRGFEKLLGKNEISRNGNFYL